MFLSVDNSRAHSMIFFIFDPLEPMILLATWNYF